MTTITNWNNSIPPSAKWTSFDIHKTKDPGVRTWTFCVHVLGSYWRCTLSKHRILHWLIDNNFEQPSTPNYGSTACILAPYYQQQSSFFYNILIKYSQTNIVSSTGWRLKSSERKCKRGNKDNNYFKIAVQYTFTRVRKHNMGNNFTPRQQKNATYFALLKVAYTCPSWNLEICWPWWEFLKQGLPYQTNLLLSEISVCKSHSQQLRSGI